MNRCIIGDCLAELPKLEADSVDACITDPPYGIGFMGKEWDTFKPGVVKQSERLVKREPIVSDNPNLNGRRRSPAISPSQIAYDRGIEGQRGFQSWTEGWAREVLRVLKPGSHLLVCGAPRSFHRMTSGLEDAGFEIRDCIMWVFGQGYPKSHNLDGEWDGWGTALKPAWEPIVVARKPLVQTVAENMRQHGTGAINVDACRVEGADGSGVWGSSNKTVDPNRTFVGSPGGADYRTERNPIGRWPANLIHDGSDEVLGRFSANAGAAAPVHRRNGDKFRGTYGAFAGNIDEQGSTFHSDSGTAARFFYCAKTSREDRNEGLNGHDRKPLNWSSGEQSPGTFQSSNTERNVANHHPTVKPTDLMRYLCRLVTPPGGVILDPFAGSFSTGKAAVLEGFNFIGIERESEYAEIGRARIAHAERAFADSTAQFEMAL